MAPKKKPSTYTPKPEVPEEARARYAAMLAVLSGETTVSEAARQLGLSRNRFQSLMHRGLAALLQQMSPQNPGRPPTPEKEAELTREVERLRRENARLQQRVHTIDRVLGAASDMLRGRVQASRSRRTRSNPETTSPTTEKADDEPEPRLERARELRASGLPAPLAAALVGAATSTLRRWCARSRAGKPLRADRGAARCAPLDPIIVECVARQVRALCGLVGAESLRRSVPGVSRRQAARIKRDTLTAMERERIQECQRIEVAAPGIVRGFDAMHVLTTGGWRFLLVSADAAVPYRTSIALADVYNGPNVALALERDFAEHGAPLVLRLDRARCHQTDDVLAVLRAWGVLVLHGPPRHPRFYGQLERQNREQRGWLDARWAITLPEPDALAVAIEPMRCALNRLWRRPTLAWMTAEQAWNARLQLAEDRSLLREEIRQRADQLLHRNESRRVSADQAERLAIEQSLTQRGYLRRRDWGRC